MCLQLPAKCKNVMSELEVSTGQNFMARSNKISTWPGLFFLIQFWAQPRPLICRPGLGPVAIS